MLVRADPVTKHDLAALVPARPARRALLPGQGRQPGRAGQREDQLRLRDLRLAGLARDGEAADRAADQLPDHGRLPRLQGGRRQRPRRLDGRRPPLLQQERRHRGSTNYANINLQPGYQRLNGEPGARLRPLPAHRLRLLPARAPAGVREGVQAAGLELADRRSTCRRSCRRSRDNVEVGSTGDSQPRPDDPPLRALRLRAAERALLPGEDRQRRPGRVLQRDRVARLASRRRCRGFQNPGRGGAEEGDGRGART